MVNPWYCRSIIVSIVIYSALTPRASASVSDVLADFFSLFGNVKRDHYLDVCGNDAIDDPNGYVYSHATYLVGLTGIPTNYGDTVDCQLDFDVTSLNGNGLEWGLQFQFESDIKLGGTANAAGCDSLTITTPPGEELASFCGGTTPAPSAIVIPSGEATINMTSVQDGNTNNGFSIFYSIVRNNTIHPCGDDEFHCDTDKCIPKKFTCDAVNHCQDSSDESADAAGCSDGGMMGIINSIMKLGLYALIGIIAGLILLFCLITCCCVWCCCKCCPCCKKTPRAAPRPAPRV